MKKVLGTLSETVEKLKRYTFLCIISSNDFMKRECKIDVKLRDTILEQVGNICKNSKLIATPLATINVRLRSGEE